jgi:hypothetical protein
MKTYRRTVAILAAPGITAARHVYTTVPANAARVAALVEISGAAAALARTVVKLRRAGSGPDRPARPRPGRPARGSCPR